MSVKDVKKKVARATEGGNDDHLMYSFSNNIPKYTSMLAFV